MVKETDKPEWFVTSYPKQQAQRVVLNDIKTAIPKRNGQSQKQCGDCAADGNQYPPPTPGKNVQNVFCPVGRLVKPDNRSPEHDPQPESYESTRSHCIAPRQTNALVGACF